MPPERTSSSAVTSASSRRPLRLGPPSMPSRAASVYTTRLTPCSARILAKWMALICERSLPAVRGHHAVGAVEAHDEALAEQLDGVVEQVERRSRRRYP